jgi:hypothetical protein
MSDDIQLNPNLAYLLGAYLSDGWMTCTGWRSVRHTVWQIKDQPFADCISIALSRLGISHTYRDGRTRGRLITVYERVGNWLGDWLHKVTPNKDRLPYVPRELVRPLTAGLMDGDGSIGARPGFQLSFAGGKPFAMDFRKLLFELSVKQGKIQRSGCPRWTINVESFLAAGLCFAMPRKQQRLAQWCRDRIYTERVPHEPLQVQGGRKAVKRRASTARWWMENVYSREWSNAIPSGSVS